MKNEQKKSETHENDKKARNEKISDENKSQRQRDRFETYRKTTFKTHKNASSVLRHSVAHVRTNMISQAMSNEWLR